MSRPGSQPIRPGRADRLDWSAWARAWLGLFAIAAANGALRQLYGQRLAEERAHQVSSVVLLVAIIPWVRRTQSRSPLPSTSAAVRVGLAWAAATVVVEFLLGRYLNKQDWAEIVGAYNVSKGRLWLLDVVGIAAAPALARRWGRSAPERTSVGLSVAGDGPGKWRPRPLTKRS